MSDLNYKLKTLPFSKDGVLTDKENIIITDTNLVVMSEIKEMFIKKSDNLYLENCNNIINNKLEKTHDINIIDPENIIIKCDNNHIFRINNISYKFNKDCVLGEFKNI